MLQDSFRGTISPPIVQYAFAPFRVGTRGLMLCRPIAYRLFTGRERETYPTFMTEGNRVDAMLMTSPRVLKKLRHYRRLMTLELTLQAEHGVEQRYACPGLEDPLACREHGVPGAAVLVQVDQEVRLDQNPVVDPVDGVVGVVMPD